MRSAAGRKVSDLHFVHSYVTAQMSAKKGLKVFKELGPGALMKELRQVILMDVMSGCHARDLTREEKRRSLRYLMFLKQKRNGIVVEQPSPPSPDQVQTDPWITVTRRKPHKSSGTNPTDPTVSFHPDLVSAFSVS